MSLSPPEGVVPGTRPDSADKARTLRLVRRKMEKRRFRIAFVLALLFHLSMVTVFEIVIPFPRHDMAYFNVSLVASPTATATADNRTGDLLTLGGDPFLMAGLPPVDLPVVEFAEIDRLRIRYDASEPLPDLDGFFEPTHPADSWSRFGGELHRLGRSLRELALPGDENTRTNTVPKPQRTLSHRPAEGFEAYIEWSGAPYDRELLFAPPVKALWEVNPVGMTRQLEIVFKVNPAGRVTNVWSPMIEETELIDDVQLTLLQYRFAPLEAYTADTAATSTPAVEQSGVLFIRAAGDTP